MCMNCGCGRPDDDKGNGASVLRLVDYPDSDTSRNAETVRRMMVNFGCTK